MAIMGSGVPSANTPYISAESALNSIWMNTPSPAAVPASSGLTRKRAVMTENARGAAALGGAPRFADQEDCRHGDGAADHQRKEKAAAPAELVDQQPPIGGAIIGPIV
jgi:hypothetical protein